MKNTIKYMLSSYIVTALKLRVQEAERLLRETDLRIFEIAYELRFADESNFSKWFHKRKNIWPTVYREQFKLERGGDFLRLVKMNIQFSHPKFTWFFSWIFAKIFAVFNLIVSGYLTHDDFALLKLYP